ncbi:hypothetical protein PM082_016363 [Marasmius tenuissimus]|nr:hypothetical protein PM082_016363 [Marasmius tenuissimus]
MYFQLSDRSSDTLNSRESDDSTAQQGAFKPSTSLVLWACIGISISSSITALSLLFHQQSLSNPGTTTEGHVLENMRWPNPYINLERVYQAGSLASQPRIQSFHNFPHAVLQVDVADPKRAFLPEKHRSYFSTEGFIYPDDRFFEASSKACRQTHFQTGCLLPTTI